MSYKKSDKPDETNNTNAKKNLYTLNIPFAGYFSAEVEAESEEAAISHFFNEVDYSIRFREENCPVEIIEFDCYKKIIEGNCLRIPMNELEIELMDEGEEND